jgi:SPP1 family predicted phage head-tail adaptor
MRNGERRHPVAIEEQIVTRGPGNEKIENWAPFVERTWARIRPMSVTGLMAAQAAQSKTSVLVEIRWREGIKRTMRIRHLITGRVYAMTADPLPDDKSGREWLTLPCSTGINDGR